MAIAVVGTPSGANIGSGTSLPVTLNAATTSGHLLVATVACATASSGSVSSITDSASQTWIRAAAGYLTGNNCRVELWYVANSASVTTVTATLSKSMAGTITVFELSGAATSSPLRVASPSTPTSDGASSTSDTTNTITPTASDFVIAATNYASATTATLNTTGYTADTHGNTASAGNNLHSAYKASATTSESVNWTLGAAAAYGTVIGAFIPAAGSTTFTTSVTGSLTSAGILVRQPAKTLTAALASAGAIIRSPFKALAGTLASVVGTLTRSRTYVMQKHIAAMQYGNIDAAICSWWGQGVPSDRRFYGMLRFAHEAGFKVCVYYEPEGQGNPTSAQIDADLQYLMAAYVNSPYGDAWFKIGGKPVIFAYADGTDGQGMNDRWAGASSIASWYYVLKVYAGYGASTNQPSNWHQYGPATQEDHQSGHSFTISPGYWKFSDVSPALVRSTTAWATAISDMVASLEVLQLVTTFNEWGEGTAVEDEVTWDTPSGYGAYLDALHATTTGHVGSYRLAFYYPWFPESWTQFSTFPWTHYQPTLGYYDAYIPGESLTLSVAGALSTIHGIVTTLRAKTLAVAGALTSAGALARRTFRTFTATSTPTGTPTKKTIRTFSGALATLTGAVATTKVKVAALAGALTSSGVVVRRVARNVAGNTNPAGALVRLPARAFGGAITNTGSLARSVAKALGGAFAASGTLSRTSQRKLAGSLGAAGSITRRAVKAFAGAITSAGVTTFSGHASIALAGAVAFAGAVSRSASRSVGGTLTSAGVLTRRSLRTLGGSIGPAASLVRQAARVVVGTAFPRGDRTAQPARTLAGASVPSGRVIRRSTQTLVATLALAGSAAKLVGKPLAGALTLTGVVGTSFVKAIRHVGVIRSSGALARTPRKALTGSIHPTAFYSKVTAFISVGGSIGAAGAAIVGYARRQLFSSNRSDGTTSSRSDGSTTPRQD